MANKSELTGKISVVILNWNQYQLTEDCVLSILKCDYPRLHTIVVDNNSNDDTPQRLYKKFGKQIDIIQNAENVGFSAGNNVGIKYALQQGAAYVMLLNNDTKVDKDFLFPLINALQDNMSVGAVTPKIYYLHKPNTIWAAGGEINWWLGRARSRGINEVDFGQYDQIETIDYATGCCILCSRTAIEQIGLLDEQYFAYFEDADWCVRAQQAGYNIVYVPDAKIWHVAGASTRTETNGKNGQTSSFAYYLNARNNLIFINRYTKDVRHLVALGSFFFRYLLFYTVAFLILRRWEKLKDLWKGAYDGWNSQD